MTEVGGEVWTTKSEAVVAVAVDLSNEKSEFALSQKLGNKNP